MERMSVNIPPPVRQKLRELADREEVREGELARRLLTQAVNSAYARAFYDAVAASMTPELERRMLDVHSRMERWAHGEPR